MSEQNTGSEVNLKNAKSEEVEKIEKVTATQAIAANEKAEADIMKVLAEVFAKGEETAEKKKAAVTKSMIEQNGYKYDSEEVKKALEEYEAKRPKPEQLIQQEREAKERLAKENEYLAQKLLAAEKGVPSDKIDKYIGYAKGIMGEGKAFKDAIEEVLKDMPVNKPVAMATGTGQSTIGASDPLLMGILGKK